MTKLRVLDLFSGIGGFSLGLERTGGFETVAFCEIEPFPRRVLAKHWPKVPIFNDITTADFASIGPVDLVTGGFPCQDISFAGKGAGLAGERSGLFWHILRTASLVGRPKLLLENVAGLLNRGMGEVLGAMASFGYDAEWHCIPASAVGAPHRRDRIWIVADSQYDWLQVGRRNEDVSEEAVKPGRVYGDDTQSGRKQTLSALAHANHVHAQRQQPGGTDTQERRGQVERQAGPCASEPGGFWATEPDVGRVAHGIPARVDRLKGLGNAVVPQIPELIGNAILAARKTLVAA